LLSAFAPLPLTKYNRREEKIMTDASEFLAADPILMVFGYGLIPLVDTSQGGDLLERIVLIRRQLAEEKGAVIPIIRLKDDASLSPAQYAIFIKGAEAARGEIIMGQYMAIIGNRKVDSTEIGGTESVEPCWGKPAFWIPESRCERAKELDCTVVEPAAVIATHLTETIRSSLHTLLTLQDVQKLVEHVKEDNPILVDELIPKHMSLNNVKQVLTILLKEGASIRDRVTILEALLDYAPATQDVNALAAYARQKLQ
jgi:flagellar biosynthesis protein FlhA